MFFGLGLNDLRIPGFRDLSLRVEGLGNRFPGLVVQGLGLKAWPFRDSLGL